MESALRRWAAHQLDLRGKRPLVGYALDIGRHVSEQVSFGEPCACLCPEGRQKARVPDRIEARLDRGGELSVIIAGCAIDTGKLGIRHRSRGIDLKDVRLQFGVVAQCRLAEAACGGACGCGLGGDVFGRADGRPRVGGLSDEQ